MVGRANAQDPQCWKRPWGLWGVGLRLKEQKGPRCAPHPWSQRVGDLIWEPSRLPGLEWVGQMPSSPLLWSIFKMLEIVTPESMIPQSFTLYNGLMRILVDKSNMLTR